MLHVRICAGGSRQRLSLPRSPVVPEKGGNPIHFAGQRRHKEICKLLVKHGAVDKLVRSKKQVVVELFRAAYSYDDAQVERILVSDPKLVAAVDKYGRTALHEACTHGDTKTVRVLLAFGADPDQLDKNGHSPTDRAVSHRQHAVVKWLEKHKSS